MPPGACSRRASVVRSVAATASDPRARGGLAGLVTGWAIAIPIGAVGALLVALTAARRAGSASAAALGIATVDGVYAAVAVVGRCGDRRRRLDPSPAGCATRPRLVLLLIAALSVCMGRRSSARSAAAPARNATAGRGRPTSLFLGTHRREPDHRRQLRRRRARQPGPHRRLGRGRRLRRRPPSLASASWQLALAGLGSMLGLSVTSRRGRARDGLGSGARDRRARRPHAARRLIAGRRRVRRQRS